jgi:hypothetical protein
MNRQATPAEVRAYLKAEGYEVRISRDGHVTYRKDRDKSPGAQPIWLEGRWLNDYRYYDGEGVVML